MSKALLMASMAMMIIVPLRAARLSGAAKGLRRAVVGTLAFNIAWAVVVLGVFLFLLNFDIARLYPQAVSQ